MGCCNKAVEERMNSAISSQGGTTRDPGSTTQASMPKQVQKGGPDLSGRGSASSSIGGAPDRNK